MWRKKKKSLDSNMIIAIIIVVILIAYIISLGKVKSDSFDVPEEMKDDKAAAKRRHQKLSELLEKKKELKKRLEKKFKRIYFWVRVGLVLLWASIMFVLYLFHCIHNLEDFLNYSEASILSIVTLNFLTFGSISGVKNYIQLIKTRVENLVYGKYLNIKEMIKKDETQIKELEKEIN